MSCTIILGSRFSGKTTLAQYLSKTIAIDQWTVFTPDLESWENHGYKVIDTQAGMIAKPNLAYEQHIIFDRVLTRIMPEFMRECALRCKELNLTLIFTVQYGVQITEHMVTACTSLYVTRFARYGLKSLKEAFSIDAERLQRLVQFLIENKDEIEQIDYDSPLLLTFA